MSLSLRLLDVVYDVFYDRAGTSLSDTSGDRSDPALSDDRHEDQVGKNHRQGTTAVSTSGALRVWAPPTDFTPPLLVQEVDDGVALVDVIPPA